MLKMKHKKMLAVTVMAISVIALSYCIITLLNGAEGESQWGLILSTISMLLVLIAMIITLRKK